MVLNYVLQFFATDHKLSSNGSSLAQPATSPFIYIPNYFCPQGLKNPMYICLKEMNVAAIYNYNKLNPGEIYT